ncbi:MULTISPECIES: FMN-binding glutamate synthase family protein [Dictyoglomus]|uniref:Ferredoxin-dependent glutamate synthase n=1 Tax=Dictyoglomus turgidum (strain DSM 6724 / Z-1310) TaxID=515635 RepID=B8DZ01_DICTD|nr:MULTISPECIES: FMN-binding glutamate synthase family protein [Dictyoglomus]ACK41627.1 ferredoxin-dependent glutamate synthase [Dictyoglomus turgidum DSM 6724]HBU32012.1 FMN-binding glutamate synthase family protein [Dictyoglomus sp.]
MSFSKPNFSEATLTRLRLKDYSPFSGMCVTCLDGCPGYCEIAKSGVRGREYIYPKPYGKVTSASEKDYPIDFSHFNINGTCVGALGVEPDPDKATFPAVDIETRIGDIKLRGPWFTTGLGSTFIARDNWEGVAIGSALFGTMVGVGENVCGVDPDAEIKNGKVIRSPEMERRIKLFKEWQRDNYGGVIVQENVEDSRLGTLEYVIEKLGIEFVEIKWGQGAKDIGGEIKLSDIKRAKQLKDRGYIVFPDPDDPVIQELYEKGGIKEFERHSRLGMASVEGFVKRAEELRKRGARYISLKTGAYRPKDLALALRAASEGKADLLIVDGAGGGTGMSPWRMMNEWGVPTVYLEALTYKYAKMLAEKGKHVPAIAIAGGFTLEDHIFKGLALGAPYVKLVAMGRSTLTAAMVGKNLGEWIKKGTIPKEYAEYGNDVEEIFVAVAEMKKMLGDDWKKVPPSALAVYGYFDRLAVGLKQFMAGARKFKLEYISRNDIVALTKEAAEVTGIPYVMDLDHEESMKILFD